MYAVYEQLFNLNFIPSEFLKLQHYFVVGYQPFKNK